MVNRSTDQTKIIDNSYSARLERLREELNRPTVTEIIRMQNRGETKAMPYNQAGDAIELTPFQKLNTSTEPFENER